MIYPQFELWFQRLQEKRNTYSVLAAVITLHIWCFISKVSYHSFLLGAFSVISIECFLLWNYLKSRLNQRSASPITLELAKIEVQKIFGDQIDYYEVVRKLEKKKYFENNKSKFIHLLQNPENHTRSPSKHNSEISNQEQLPLQNIISDESTQVPSLQFSHKEINHLLQKKLDDQQKEKSDTSPERNLNKSFVEEKIPPIKLGKKIFVNQLNELTDILSQIGSCERNYGKLLDAFEIKNNILLLNQDEGEEGSQAKAAENQFEILDFKNLHLTEIEFLNKKFKNKAAGKQYLCLSGWIKFKQTINFMGLTHINFSRFVHKAVKPLIDIMIANHEDKYKEIKKERKRVSKEYEEDYTTFVKTKKELESLNKTLETTLTEYQVQYKKKAEDEVILKLEMKARLTKSQIDSQKNKVSNMTDKYRETKKSMVSQNQKNLDFLYDRENQKNAECYNIFKNVILGFVTDLEDIEKSFKSLIQFESSEKDQPNLGTLTDLGGDEQDPLTVASKSQITTTKKVRRRNASETYNRSPVRGRSMSTFTETKPSFDLNACLPSNVIDELKMAIEDQNQVIAENTTLFEQETKKNKSIVVVLETLTEFQVEYFKEMEKLMSLDSLSSKIDTLTTFWRITQNGFANINQVNGSLRQKLSHQETSYENCMKIMEKEFTLNESSAQKVVKKALSCLKTFEKDFEKRDLQKNPEKSDFFSKLFNFDDAPPMTDEQIAIERNNILDELEKSSNQFSDFINRYKTEAANLKKTLIIFYLQYLTDQQIILSNLLEELEKVHQESKISEKPEVAAGLQTSSEKSINESQSGASPNITLRKDSDLASLSQSPSNAAYINSEILDHRQNQNPENTIWINKMLKVFALEWAKSGYFKEKIIKSFFKAFNKKRSKFIRRMNVKDVIIDPTFPDIRSIEVLPSNDFEFLYDFHLVYQGNAFVEIETRIEPQPIISIFNGDEPIPLSAKVLLKGLNAKIRLCWVPSEYGRSWFSFIGQPVLDVVVEPKIGISQFDIGALPQAKNLITELIMMRVKKMIYPYRKELDLPMAFRDPKIIPPPE